MKILVLSSSLDPASRSRLMVRRAFGRLERQGSSAAWLDVATLELPHCDGGSAWEHEHTGVLTEAVASADGVLLGLGVYNYACSSAAKTIIELAGRAWSGKVVGFCCAAGGQGSYMAVMNLANSLMLDFRCVIVPRFVYAVTSAFEGDEIVDAKVNERIDELADELARMTRALGG